MLARAIDAVADDAPAPADERRAVSRSRRRAWRELARRRRASLIVCGRFEGVDERVIAARALEEVSIGDYVLSGGEIAAMALIDACVRVLPGVMGKPASGVEESFAAGLLEYPQYTRPQALEGHAIPDVLLSGDHARIAAFRRAEAERLTRERRPDLWAKYAAHKDKPA